MYTFNIATAFPAQPSLDENAVFIALGFTFVVVVLAALALVTQTIGAIIKRTSGKAQVVPTTTPVQAPVASEDAIFSDLDTPEHAPAIIAAAVFMALEGKPHRIVGVSNHRWAHEGRREIFSSHRLR